MASHLWIEEAVDDFFAVDRHWGPEGNLGRLAGFTLNVLLFLDKVRECSILVTVGLVRKYSTPVGGERVSCRKQEDPGQRLNNTFLIHRKGVMDFFYYLWIPFAR